MTGAVKQSRVISFARRVFCPDVGQFFCPQGGLPMRDRCGTFRYFPDPLGIVPSKDIGNFLPQGGLPMRDRCGTFRYFPDRPVSFLPWIWGSFFIKKGQPHRPPNIFSIAQLIPNVNILFRKVRNFCVLYQSRKLILSIFPSCGTQKSVLTYNYKEVIPMYR